MNILFIAHHNLDLSDSSGCFIVLRKSHICALETLKPKSSQISVSINLNLNLSNNTIKMGQSVYKKAHHNYFTGCCEIQVPYRSLV